MKLQQLNESIFNRPDDLKEVISTADMDVVTKRDPAPKPQSVYPGDLDDVIAHFVQQDRALPIYISGYYDDSMLLVSTTPFNPKDFA